MFAVNVMDVFGIRIFLILFAIFQWYSYQGFSRGRDLRDQDRDQDMGGRDQDRDRGHLN